MVNQVYPLNRPTLSTSFSVVIARSIHREQEIRIRRLDYRRDSLKDIFLRAMEVNRGGL